MTGPSTRFTGRSAAYVRGRPSYPSDVVDALESLGLPPGGLVVDAGAGTGIASRLFLSRGYRVIAIEPNAEMRAAALQAGVDARDGRGEATGLPSACADLVLCAQAFHWMDRPAAWAEFQRVAKPGALLALLWNQRIVEGDPFLEQLEALLRRHAAEDPQVSEGAGLRQWPGATLIEFRHSQPLDWPGLLARISSMSYMPLPGSPRHDAMAAGLRVLFETHQRGGLVTMLYHTRLYWARNGSVTSSSAGPSALPGPTPPGNGPSARRCVSARTRRTARPSARAPR
jgi:SAM-dependent methyltransferase